MTRTSIATFFEIIDNHIRYYYDDEYRVVYKLTDGTELSQSQSQPQLVLNTLLTLYNTMNNDSIVCFEDLELSSGFYTIDALQMKLNKEKEKYEFFQKNDSPSITKYIEFMDTHRDEITQLILLDHLCSYMVNHSYKMVHIVYE
jgi:hypothetical protein